MSNHLDDFRTSLESRNNTPVHIKTTIGRIKALLTETGVKMIDDLDGSKVLNTLAKWRSRKKKPMSIASSNHDLVAIKGFTRWLWQEKQTTEDVFVNLKKPNSQTDRRRVRRAMTEEEVQNLLKITSESRKTYRGRNRALNPSDRNLLYSIALYTSLRPGQRAPWVTQTPLSASG